MPIITLGHIRISLLYEMKRVIVMKLRLSRKRIQEIIKKLMRKQ